LIDVHRLRSRRAEIDAELRARGGRAGGCGIGGNGTSPGVRLTAGACCVLVTVLVGAATTDAGAAPAGGPGARLGGRADAAGLPASDPSRVGMAPVTSSRFRSSAPTRAASRSRSALKTRKASASWRPSLSETDGGAVLALMAGRRRPNDGRRFRYKSPPRGRDAKDRDAAPGAEPPRFARDCCPRSFLVALASCHGLQPGSRIILKTLAESGDPDARAGDGRASTAMALRL